MPANGLPFRFATFSQCNVRTNDFKPTATKAPVLAMRAGGGFYKSLAVWRPQLALAGMARSYRWIKHVW